MNFSFKKTTILLRIFGALIAIIGGLLFWFGGKQLTLDLFGGVVVPLPLEYFLIIAGLLLLLLPLVPVYILALILPDKFERRLLNYADSLDPEYIALEQNPNPQNVATILHRHIRRANKRSYLFMFIAVLFIFVILPLLVRNAISISQYRRESDRLVSLVQETRIDFASGDHFREHLHDAEGGMTSDPTSTRQIYDVLRNLYDPSIKQQDGFYKAIDQVYLSRVKAHATEAGLLRIEAFKLKRASSESDLAPATYLTLLATVCNIVGDHGRHLDPYIQGRQLLSLAFTYTKKNENMPATHNMAGVNFAGLLAGYDRLKEKFTTDQSALQSALAMSGMPSQLSLLRQAKAEYVLAEQQSPTNLAKARSLNNQVDIMLTFLYLIHVKKQLDTSIIRDDTDRRFLEEELAIKLPEKSVDLQRLVQILDGYNHDLTVALELSQEPDIYFTRAQLLSIGGSLGEEHKLTTSFWGGSDNVAESAFKDLSIAHSLHLPKRLFQKSVKEQYYLEWLWKRLEPRLEKLSVS